MAEAQAHEARFDQFFERLPKELIFERELLRSRLWCSPGARAATSRPWLYRVVDRADGS
ncbi:MAG: hypothetical protein ACT4O2_12805 [Beijerinckiaceae bacterium]